jgi:peptidoglycan/xylan/chitin deacetylase (PgdA/CDA1 family)/sulfur carrier protein ThiS
MNPRFRSLLGLQVIVVVVAFAIPLLAATGVRDLPPPVEVFVRGEKPIFLDRGTTLGQALAGLHLRPHSGSLLDVEGRILRKHAFPGRILLDGMRASRRTVLSDGDRIRVVSHPNQVEPLARRVIRLPGRHPEDPQFYLGTAPGEEVVTTGKISGELVSTMFQPTGPLRQPRSVGLTFDDGPNPIDTPRILSILHRFHVHATFFTIGYLVQRYPDIVRREQRMGMVVGDHTWDHPNRPPFKTLPPEVITSEMQRAQIELDSIGVKTHLFRPPGGSTSTQVETIAQGLEMRVVLWSVDPRDWENGISSTAIVVSVLSSVRPGSIVILHDGGGDQSATAAALPQIIKGIRKMHMQIEPVR